MNAIHQELQQAFSWRKNFGHLDHTEALRIFYGPGESATALKNIAIDVFQEHAWITQWGKVSPEIISSVVQFLRLLAPWSSPIQSVVLIDRSGKPTTEDAADEVRTLWGHPPLGRFSVQERGVPHLIQLRDTKHPGLFLDHAPLRHWLLESQSNKRVLNLFSYSGSLSVAAGKGGASFVVTIDLSKPTIGWAQENWANAGLSENAANFIFGDVLEWLPRLKKKNEQFDTILCDPPSFSRSKNGTFSTKKDSVKLHTEIFPLLKVGGILVTSINSENISEEQFLNDVRAAAEKCKMTIRVLRRIDLPETFPTSAKGFSERYLKGFFILRQA